VVNDRELRAAEFLVEGYLGEFKPAEFRDHQVLTQVRPWDAVCPIPSSSCTQVKSPELH
jgi:hypothetical protein